MSNSDPAQLLAHGLHLGHQKNKISPKAKRYIHSYQKGTSIIDLMQTATLLDEAKKYITDLAKDGKTLMVVATKKVARQPVSEICAEYNIPYMTNKWVGGFLTNFSEVSQNIKKMNDLRVAQTEDGWTAYPKHERIQMEKKLNRIASVYSGVAKMEKAPDALFIIDIKKEKNALNEANQMGVPTVSIVDTNVNPDPVTYPIPANDDAITSITFLMKEIAETYSKNFKPKA